MERFSNIHLQKAGCTLIPSIAKSNVDAFQDYLPLMSQSGKSAEAAAVLDSSSSAGCSSSLKSHYRASILLLL